jgi:hypothetical protein
MKRSRWILLATIAVLMAGFVTAGPATGAKALAFGGQPADAEKGLAITTVKFDASDGTATGPFVTVIASSNTRVTVSITGGSALQTVRADGNGVATFENLTIGTPGTYTLTATANGFDPSPASSSFRIFDSVDTCGGQSTTCNAPTGTLKDNRLVASFTGTSTSGGILASSIGIEGAPTCTGDGSYFNSLPGVVSAYWTNIDGEIVVTLTVSKSYDQEQANNGANFYQVCFTYDDIRLPNGDPKTFTDRYGNENVTTGFLRDCGPKIGPPCVQSRSKDNKGNVKLVLRIPEDMKMR